PGLLLSVTGKPIFQTVRGLWCKDVFMRAKPRSLDVNKLPGKDGYHLVVDRDYIWFGQSPADLAEELKKWAKFYFDELKPGLKKFPIRRGGGMKKLLAKNAISCPDCGTLLLPRLGDVGVDMTVKT